ncbi:FAD-dependent oxidoreductase [Nonomuraea mangrovi]|uniref:FAD-dependent oxidoreductase n=1 Tax=Nonomuraea mangrovi TaxID=2316207 RepID=A0ABW4T0K3_9ACTN
MLGGGAIGCEIAQVFAAFGVEVTVIEAADRLLAVEEPDASAAVAKAFAAEGITVRTSARAEWVEHDGDGFRILLADGTVTAERLLVAAGRHNNLRDLGLEHVGLDPQARVLDPDERMRVAEGVWAIGDITGKGAFTHMSMYQADVVIRDLTRADGPWADYGAVGRVTFTSPEVGSVGLTEAAARERGIDVRTATGDLGTRGWIAEESGPIKLVADAERGVLIGGTVVGSFRGRGARRARDRDPRRSPYQEPGRDALRLPDLPPRAPACPSRPDLMCFVRRWASGRTDARSLDQRPIATSLLSGHVAIRCSPRRSAAGSKHRETYSDLAGSRRAGRCPLRRPGGLPRERARAAASLLHADGRTDVINFPNRAGGRIQHTGGFRHVERVSS